jgi:integrase
LELVFTTACGGMLEPRRCYDGYKALLSSAGLPSIGFHNLRHTMASLLLSAGIDLKTISQTMGHSQISLTMNTYTHVLPALKENAAASMNAILTSTGP